MKLFGAAAVSALLFAGVEGFSEAVKNVRGNMGTDRVIHFPYTSLSKEARDILADVDEFGNTETGTDMKVSFQTVSALESAGYEFDDMTDDWISKFESNFESSSFVCEDGAAACSQSNTFYESYQRLDALHARLDSIAASSSGLATIGTFGDSLEGRDQKIIEIGSGDKPIIFFFCGIHAREWLPPAFCTYMAETLVNNGAGHPLLDKVKFLICPVANPDGYEYSHTVNNMWRKSRKPNSGSSCVGTDLNRNYDAHFCETGASSNPCSDTYCGTGPFDNVETLNLKNYVENLMDNGETILMNVDVHAYGSMWMSPYGWTNSLPPTADYSRMNTCGQAAADAIRGVNGLNFAVGSIANVIYTVAGGSNDFFYETHNIIYGYGIEVRENSFQPPTSNIMPSNLEMFEGMRAAVECAYNIEYEGGSTPTPPPTTDSGCADLVPSGLTWSGSGQPAECVDLPNYCADYEVVRERCPETCGLCGATCEDNDPSGLTYTNGQPAPCNEIERYCSTYESVREACPNTCGLCEQYAEKTELLVISIDEIEDEGSDDGAIYGAIAVAGVGFVGAVAALAYVVRKQKQTHEGISENDLTTKHYAL
mmetsp:Transcript_1991/g.2851  ORF Transcript_1991/g.2851 Transcript_1991/m.2851 type:complete len:595 (+) Transcript_1991:624-2408(+)